MSTTWRGLAHLQAGAAARPPGAAAPLSPQAAPAPVARQPSPVGATAFDATGNPARPSAAPTKRFNWILDLGVALALLALAGGGAQESERVAVQALHPTPYVAVYGRQSCSLTRQMMQDLDQHDIDLGQSGVDHFAPAACHASPLRVQ